MPNMSFIPEEWEATRLAKEAAASRIAKRDRDAAQLSEQREAFLRRLERTAREYPTVSELAAGVGVPLLAAILGAVVAFLAK